MRGFYDITLNDLLPTSQASLFSLSIAPLLLNLHMLDFLGAQPWIQFPHQDTLLPDNISIYVLTVLNLYSPTSPPLGRRVIFPTPERMQYYLLDLTGYFMGFSNLMYAKLTSCFSVFSPTDAPHPVILISAVATEPII